MSHPEVLSDVVFVQPGAASRRTVDRSPRTLAATAGPAQLPWLEILFLVGCLMMLLVVATLSRPTQFSMLDTDLSGLHSAAPTATAIP
ncbi:MAG: hypothetical protein U1E06_19105 [Tabrizicola sp.]|uniref:hypothetical protein n=1 Tax=Tabrizicola sp. TaxID=2005166 RepID=UPI0027357A9E|nr:hypothetical protein [Tabrizicola sp.]MDP3264334.1 hypothetical protein [Tabrizicola sp.]MDP3648621.1 hypothetical protein [Paracoccaceae bacterium]MDZ4068916.1 hypothetical protein [Tabrizicola sp.]